MDVRNNLDFVQNQENNINIFIKKIYSRNVANLAVIEIDNFNGIGIVYGIKAISKMAKNFCLKALDFFPKNYELYTLGFGVFALVTNEKVSLKTFLKNLNVFKNLFVKHEFTINEKVKICLSLYIGVSSKYSPSGNSKYRFDVLREAFCALLDTKNSHKHLIVFDKTQTSLKNIQEKIKITKLVYQAFVDDALIPYFQPIVDLKTGAIFKYEALARIQTSDNKLIYPKDFFKVLKHTVVYVQAVKRLIQKAFNVVVQKGISISINLNVADIEDPEISEWLLDEISKRNLGNLVTIEITEHERIKDFAKLSNFFKKIRKTGAKIAIDDFGCGYSNLEIVMHIPIDFIKIDGSFIIDIDQDPHKAQIVAGIVNFAKALKIATIAEFVSTREIYKKVKSLEVDYVQGYFTGKPINLEQNMLKSQ
ncbi:hypothetical protein BKH41_07295 [Helicobacter sp. 12S02232-10]|uniref:EAL domain-containing protein n=1 Tax=Helicobacter sp. 12S02232-10 TaxID=1476197 RepID=UPI000BA52189|nr:EAL domain-containing protein [Helicobacter sp. 12S02232-10]PAF47686.1 hypothetical protein BKH41_07295 [Helicobacter sp. 12S02232-10]